MRQYTEAVKKVAMLEQRTDVQNYYSTRRGKLKADLGMASQVADKGWCGALLRNLSRKKMFPCHRSLLGFHFGSGYWFASPDLFYQLSLLPIFSYKKNSEQSGNWLVPCNWLWHSLEPHILAILKIKNKNKNVYNMGLWNPKLLQMLCVWFFAWKNVIPERQHLAQWPGVYWRMWIGNVCLVLCVSVWATPA